MKAEIPPALREPQSNEGDTGPREPSADSEDPNKPNLFSLEHHYFLQGSAVTPWCPTSTPSFLAPCATSRGGTGGSTFRLTCRDLSRPAWGEAVLRSGLSVSECEDRMTVSRGGAHQRTGSHLSRPVTFPETASLSPTPPPPPCTWPLVWVRPVLSFYSTDDRGRAFPSVTCPWLRDSRTSPAPLPQVGGWD